MAANLQYRVWFYNTMLNKLSPAAVFPTAAQAEACALRTLPTQREFVIEAQVRTDPGNALVLAVKRSELPTGDPQDALDLLPVNDTEYRQQQAALFDDTTCLPLFSGTAPRGQVRPFIERDAPPAQLPLL